MTGKAARFMRGEDGAVSVEYLPFIAMMIGLGILVVSLLVPGADRPDREAARAISDIDFVELAGGERDAGNAGPAEHVRRNDAGTRPGQGEDRFVPRTIGCASVDTSCSGLGDGTNPGASSDSNNAAGTPGGDGTDNPNQAD